MCIRDRFSSPLIGRWADKVGRLKVYRIFGVLALVPIFLITHLPQVAVPIALLVTSAFFVVATGRTIPSTTMVTSAVRPQNRGSFMSINSAVRQLASGFAAYIAGLIVAEGANGTLENYNYVGYFAIFFSILTLFIAPKLKVVDND